MNFDLIYVAIASLFAIMLHEISHGLMSYALGDPTPKRQGRLSLNPAKHLDLVGTLCLIFFHVGWAKPVVVNSEYYKKPKLGMFLVALAGPLMNLISAVISIIIMVLIVKYVPSINTFVDIILTLSMYFAIISIGLAVFNLLPIPPLDGSKILGSFLKGDVYYQYMKYQQYGFIILSIFLLLSSMSGNPFISDAVTYIYNFILSLMFKIFGIA